LQKILQRMAAMCVASHHRNMPNDLPLMAISALDDMT
jgi:tRNA(Met) C34 N-acetyltransferase TmcA